MRVIWVLGLGASCALQVDNVVAGADSDRDGFVSLAAGGDDCDDGDASVNPGAAEVCGDGVDNDCDRVIDDAGEGDVLWHRDGDGDGHGVDEDAFRACPGAASTEGFVAFGGDCDDAEPEVHPGLAVDACNLIDDDCDGEIDEDPGATVLGQWYPTVDDAVAVALQQREPAEVTVCGGTEPLPVTAFSLGDTQSLTLRGLAPEGQRVAVVSRRGATVARVGQVGHLVLSGLSIRGAGTGPAVVAQDRATLEITDCEIRDNPGSGVRIEGLGSTGYEGVTAQIQRTSIVDNGNELQGEGGGLSLQGAYTVTLEDVTVSGNRARSGAGLFAVPDPGAFFLSSLALTRTVVEANVAGDDGGGLYLSVPRFVQLVDTQIRGNQAERGAGLFLVNTEVRGDGPSQVSDNVATDKAGGAYLQGESFLVDLQLVGNQAVEGGGVAAGGDGTPAAYPQLTRVSLQGNEAPIGGAIRLALGGNLRLLDCEVLANAASGSGGGAFLGQGASLSVDSSDWGTPETSDDNTPNDVEIVTDEVYAFGNGVSFQCIPNVDPDVDSCGG